jgi:hypothetical protein
VAIRYEDWKGYKRELGFERRPLLVTKEEVLFLFCWFSVGEVISLKGS